MGPDDNSNVTFLTADGKEINPIEGLEKYVYPKIPIHKKRKTIIKYLMSLGFSRNTAVEEAEWIKLLRKMRFNGIGYTVNMVMEMDDEARAYFFGKEDNLNEQGRINL